jgi:hypothetical protein
MNIREKRTFVILMEVIGCLVFNSSLNAEKPRWMINENFKLLSGVSPLQCEPLSLAATNNNLLTNALSSRMTNVKGYSASPFVHAIYGHNVDVKFEYKNSMYGFILGVDNVWTFDDEKYFRLGTALGYIHGQTTPFNIFFKIRNLHRRLNVPPIDPKQVNTDFSHDIYSAKLFGAYESFDDKCLKTNIGVILGYNHSRDKYQVGNMSMHLCAQTYEGKFVSDNIFLGMDFVKNLYAYDGYQFGLWFQTSYNYTLQHTYIHTISREYGDETDQFDKLNGDFLATVLGLNMEKETFEHAGKKLTLSLKIGLEYRTTQRVVDDSNLAKFLEDFTVVSFRASQKLNNHWSIGGSYAGSFSKDFLSHSLAGGVEYAF